MYGGTGADNFIFAEMPGIAEADRVGDFAPGSDRLLFYNDVFTELGAAGDWSGGDERFIAGPAFISGQEGDDRLVYNTSTGDLYYDADGSGAGTALLIATLQGAPALAATDITVV